MTGGEVLPHTPSFSPPMLSVFPRSSRSLHWSGRLERHHPSSPALRHILPSLTCLLPPRENKGARA
ncbi:hypothetical protein I79_001014 [Cricetulus griseus]|uniref:Uncharacterized protein n=1 Tax=Cricetulus griseus TaxID=10029 RepID=G3GTM9_CRIGR|nr:hypothetical protein I79_001014 [Cricetulus griseus]